MFSREYDWVSRVSETKVIYRRKGNLGRRPRRPGGTHASRWRLGAVGPLAAPLLAPSLFLRKNKSCKFAANSEKLPRTAFLKKQKQKTGTGTGHLVDRLVP